MERTYSSSLKGSSATEIYRGLEADQKVIAAHGCYAMTTTTALTAQNTQGVQDIFHIPPGFVRKQIDACINDIGVDVVKTGMPWARYVGSCDIDISYLGVLTSQRYAGFD